MTATMRPAERYGAPRPWMRPLVVTVTVVLAVLGGAWVVWAGLEHASPAVSAQLRTFEVLDERTVTATIVVEREPGVSVVCLLEAQAADHFVVGERRLVIPAGRRDTVSRIVRITTERQATNAVLDSCRPG